MKDRERQKDRRGSQVIYSVDSFLNGISFGRTALDSGADLRDYFNLRLLDDDELHRLRRRYALNRDKPRDQLESNLMKLSRSGSLSSAMIFFGVSTDPFHPFEGKFDTSMKFLDLFRRYTPGMLQIQTRSPLIVLALPILKALGPKAGVTIALETNCDKSARRYTPGLPKIAERLKAATALRRFGVEVTLQIAPVLPYGDWRKDAGEFAQLVAEHADYVDIRPLSDGSPEVERRVAGTQLAKLLAEDRKFHWLRPDSATPLITAMEKIAPEKLRAPVREHLKDRQLDIFVA